MYSGHMINLLRNYYFDFNSILKVSTAQNAHTKIKQFGNK